MLSYMSYLMYLFTARLNLSIPYHSIHCNEPFASVYCRIYRLKVAVIVALGVEEELSHLHLPGASVLLDRVWFSEPSVLHVN